MHREDRTVVPVVHAAFASLDALPPPDADQRGERLADALPSNELAKKAAEAIRSIENFREKSTWFREGREEGWERGNRAGREEGREEGREKGAVEMGRAAVVRVLSRRSVDLSAVDRARIDACTDLATLERWLDRAVVANTAEEALRLPPCDRAHPAVPTKASDCAARKWSPPAREPARPRAASRFSRGTAGPESTSCAPLAQAAPRQPT
jgi:hypothetical protein